MKNEKHIHGLFLGGGRDGGRDGRDGGGGKICF